MQINHIKQRYWVLFAYGVLLLIGPWLINVGVHFHRQHQRSHSVMIEILYSVVLTSVWIWIYAVVLALLISLGMFVLKSKREKEIFLGFQLVGVVHIILVLGLLAYAFLIGLSA